MRHLHRHASRAVLRDTRAIAFFVSASVVLATSLLVSQSRTPRPPFTATPYFPDRWSWETRKPEELGFDAGALQEAAKFAIANEAKTHRDGDDLARMVAGEPYNAIVGPTMTRGATSGLVIRNGYIALEWGDTDRVDWTFSATKSYVATTIGLAWDAGLIRDLNDPVVRYVQDGTFSSPHNSKITWVHLLQQSSEWQGTLWGKPDWADRYDGKQKRPVLEPGSKMTYNDVRVNLAALASLHVWRRPLPGVLRDLVMDPIGASPSWRWWGYDNSWVDIDGLKVQSVAGGGHWGGGLWISARDHARFGLLHLRRGKWNGKQLISEKWIQMATAPTGPNPNYGFMWWLNANQKQLASAPAYSYWAAGGGGNFVWVDQERDLVVVTRWVPDLNGVVQRVLAATRPQAPSAQRQ